MMTRDASARRRRVVLGLLAGGVLSAFSAELAHTASPYPGLVQARANQRDTAARAGSGRVGGRIFADDTRAAVPRALVRIVSPALKGERAVRTDAQGRYQFEDLPPGQYSVTATATGYLSASFSQTTALGRDSHFDLRDKEERDNVDVTLTRGGVITGTVVDDYGQPVERATVHALKANGSPSPEGRFLTSTPDNGEFRVWGLREGEFYLVASVSLTSQTTAISEDRIGYAPSYYPGTLNIAEAQKLTVSAGQVVSGIVLTLQSARLARVTGRALSANGEPLRGGTVTVVKRTGTMVSILNSIRLGLDGTFTVPNLSPGDYQLRAGGVPTATENRPEASEASVSVNGVDIDGVDLAPPVLGSVSGRILVRSSNAGAVDPAMFRISLDPLETQSTGRGGSAEVRRDATFDIKSPPGLQNVRLSAPSREWWVKSVRMQDQDITDAGIIVTSSQVTSGIEIELTDIVQGISGHVSGPGGDAPRAAVVVVFSQERERWRFAQRYFSSAATDLQGRFSIPNLPPGRYNAVAVGSFDSAKRSDVNYLERLSGVATRFTLVEGQPTSVDLPLIETFR